MNPRTDLDSLPILDNPDNFVAHAYAAFILILSDVATNNLPQLNSFRSYSTRSSSFSKQRLFISRMPNFYSTIFLVSQIASLPCVELSYALVC